MSGCCEVSTTVESESAAAALAAALVERHLAACVQVDGPVRSTYRWKGSVETSTEWTCRAKTTEARVAELVATIRSLHTYELPEIVVTPLSGGDPGYLEWIRSQTMP